MGGLHMSTVTAQCRAAGTGSQRLPGLSRFAQQRQRGDPLTNAETQHQLVSSLQLPVEAELELKGLPAPHHQALHVVCIRVVQAGVLALEKVNPSDLQIGPWKAVSREGERKKEQGVDGKLLGKDSFLLLNGALWVIKTSKCPVV